MHKFLSIRSISISAYHPSLGHSRNTKRKRHSRFLYCSLCMVTKTINSKNSFHNAVVLLQECYKMPLNVMKHPNLSLPVKPQKCMVKSAADSTCLFRVNSMEAHCGSPLVMMTVHLGYSATTTSQWPKHGQKNSRIKRKQKPPPANPDPLLR